MCSRFCCYLCRVICSEAVVLLCCFAFPLESIPSWPAVPIIRHPYRLLDVCPRDLEPSCGVSVRIVFLQISQLRPLRNEGSLQRAWTTAPVRALKGTYISANFGTCRPLGDVVDFRSHCEVTDWWMRTTTTSWTSAVAPPEADLGAIVDEVSEAFAANRFWTRLLTGLWLGTGWCQA